jgi:hypothetical protein
MPPITGQAAQLSSSLLEPGPTGPQEAQRACEAVRRSAPTSSGGSWWGLGFCSDGSGVRSGNGLWQLLLVAARSRGVSEAQGGQQAEQVPQLGAAVDRPRREPAMWATPARVARAVWLRPLAWCRGPEHRASLSSGQGELFRYCIYSVLVRGHAAFVLERGQRDRQERTELWSRAWPPGGDGLGQADSTWAGSSSSRRRETKCRSG